MKSHIIRTDSLTQAVIEAGPQDGPLVILIHGFPELAISWRAQLEAFGATGWRAVAPDMRGYGGTDRPEAADAYGVLSLVGDMVDLVRALGGGPAVVIGHDWGAPVAWHCALLRPDLFRAVAGLSVPFQPRRPMGPPTEAMAAISKRLGRGDLYINRFQAPDAHAPLDADPATALRKIFWSYDGATADADQSSGFLPPGVDLLDTISEKAALPPWMTPDHFAEYVAAFSAGGFRAPFDWYRCLDLNWRQTAFLQDQKIAIPALFIVGDRDPVRNYSGAHEAALGDWVPGLRGAHVLPGVGHWLQQEAPDRVNALLIDFLQSL